MRNKFDVCLDVIVTDRSYIRNLGEQSVQRRLVVGANEECISRQKCLESTLGTWKIEILIYGHAFDIFFYPPTITRQVTHHRANFFRHDFQGRQTKLTSQMRLRGMATITQNCMPQRKSRMHGTILILEIAIITACQRILT